MIQTNLLVKRLKIRPTAILYKVSLLKILFLSEIRKALKKYHQI